MYHLTIFWFAVVAACSLTAYVVGRIHGARPKLTEEDLLALQERARDATNDEGLSADERASNAALWHAANAALGRRGATRAERAAGLAVCHAASRAVRP